jgi:hypothetical protein
MKLRHSDKLGVDWNQRQRTFIVADGDGPPLVLTAQELIELGIELVMTGMEAMTVKRWQ